MGMAIIKWMLLQQQKLRDSIEDSKEITTES
jgi:hypothetical protein